MTSRRPLRGSSQERAPERRQLRCRCRGRRASSEARSRARLPQGSPTHRRSAGRPCPSRSQTFSKRHTWLLRTAVDDRHVGKRRGLGGAPPDPEDRCRWGVGKESCPGRRHVGASAESWRGCMWVFCAWGGCHGPWPAAGAQKALWKAWTRRARWLSWRPGPPHSLIELGGSAQWLAHVGRQVPGVLRGGPRQLLALGMVHVADVVQRPGLPDLRVAPRLGDPLQTRPPRSPWPWAPVPAAPEAKTQRAPRRGGPHVTAALSGHPE